MWKTKSRTFVRPYVGKLEIPGSTVERHYADWSGSEVIRYQSLPKYTDSRLTWKQCHHTRSSTVRGSLFSGSLVDTTSGRKILVDCVYPRSSDPGLPSGKPLDVPVTDLFDQFYDSLDLNCRDSALVYSGIVQAVPLLGAATRVNAVLRRLARRLSSDLRRKPFTTVIRSAISLDFIERFVVKPTLDDMHKLQTSMDYVIDTIRRAWERSGSVIPYSVEINRSKLEEDSQVTLDRTYGTPTVVKARLTKSLISFGKLNALATVYYRPEEIRPIQLWAARCGLTKPLGSIWDLVPFSFVADYFFRAGEFLDGIDNMISGQEELKGRIGNVHSLWITRKTGRSVTYEALSVKPKFPSITRDFNVSGGTCSFEDMVFDRYPASLNDYSQSGFWDEKWASFSPSLSVTRKRTLVELFLQRKLR